MMKVRIPLIPRILCVVSLTLITLLSGSSGAQDAVRLPDIGLPAHAQLFGEDQGLYVVSCDELHSEEILATASKNGLFAQLIGRTEGEDLTFVDIASISVTEMRTRHQRWLPAYMAGELAL